MDQFDDYSGGFLLGLIFSIFGLFIGLFGGQNTKRGAKHGFMLNTLIIGIIVIIVLGVNS